MFGNMARMFLPNDRKLLDYEEKAFDRIFCYLAMKSIDGMSRMQAEVNAFSMIREDRFSFGFLYFFEQNGMYYGYEKNN